MRFVGTSTDLAPGATLDSGIDLRYAIATSHYWIGAVPAMVFVGVCFVAAIFFSVVTRPRDERELVGLV